MAKKKYPSFELFPPPRSSDTNIYVACDTGVTYCVLAGVYQPFWPSSDRPVDYQKPGVIGSNRTLQDTIHVRS